MCPAAASGRRCRRATTRRGLSWARGAFFSAAYRLGSLNMCLAGCAALAWRLCDEVAALRDVARSRQILAARYAKAAARALERVVDATIPKTQQHFTDGVRRFGGHVLAKAAGSGRRPIDRSIERRAARLSKVLVNQSRGD